MTAIAVTINLAIVGLSVRTVHELRKKIMAASPAGVGYNWVSVTDPSLDMLLIHEDFAQTPSIRRIIEQRSLSVLHFNAQGALHDVNQPNALRGDHDVLRDCIDQHLRRHLNPRPPVDGAQDEATLGEPVAAPCAGPAPAAQMPWRLEVYRNLLARHSSTSKLINAQGVGGLIDAQQHLWWPAANASATGVMLNQGLTVTYATAADRALVDDTPLDLHQWLWQLIWIQSDQQALEVPDVPVRLLGWPQPRERELWKEVMGMSAALHRRPMRAAQLAAVLEVPRAQADRFVFSLLASGLARP